MSSALKRNPDNGAARLTGLAKGRRQHPPSPNEQEQPVVKTYEIHPSIGVARVGNSEDPQGFFIAPDEPPPDSFRDASANQALKRQAARFRLFECERDATGRLVSAKELTGQSGVIVQWSVNLVNRKGAAPNFLGSGNRNDATGDDVKDKALIIAPRKQSRKGAKQKAVSFNGEFMKVPVHLGDIWTDDAGRLLVAGGRGQSSFVKSPGKPQSGQEPTSFADNDSWFDDTSDGPVRAAVTLADGTVIKEKDVKPAWVIVGPPDFAPPVYNFITLYDVAYQVGVEQGWLAVPVNPSFTAHVYPILSRAVGYQWVNQTARLGHGPDGGGNFDADWAALADPAGPATVRQAILKRLRNPKPPLPLSTGSSMPRLHDETNSSEVLPPTVTQYAILEKWVAGTFEKDWDATATDVEARRAVLLKEKSPETLDRLALEACSGGAFFPGIEAGSIMKRAAIYAEPFRLKVDALKPGEITQGNALPWQADFYACRWDGHPGGIGIGWWPAQRPDDVFPEKTPDEMHPWDDGVNSKGQLVLQWHLLGVVRRKAGASGPVLLETERQLPRA
jgi:hypothetical protein